MGAEVTTLVGCGVGREVGGFEGTATGGCVVG